MATPGMTPEDEVLLQEKFEGMQVAGFVLTLTVMHSFTMEEPADPEKHALSKGGVRAALWFILFIMKVVCK